MGRPGAMRGRRCGSLIAAVALLVVSLAVGMAAAASPKRAGGLDLAFGKAGRVIPALPEASARSLFDLVAVASGGRLLVADVYESDRSEYHTVIERREANGALDPSFGDDGSVGLAGAVDVLTEDPAGGVVFSGSSGMQRLGPTGDYDKAFDKNARYNSAKGIAFDSQGRIIVGRVNPQGPRYHPHEGELEVLRFEPDGRPDPTFGEKSVVYLGQAEGGNGELGLLADGSIVVEGAGVDHLTPEGTPLTGFEEPGGEGSVTSLVSFPDGSFAISRAPYNEPGCTVTRYDSAGSFDQSFATKGAFTDPGLDQCELAVAPEGGLLVRAEADAGGGEPAPRLLLLSAAGTPVPSFGSGGSVTVAAPTKGPDAAPLKVEAACFTATGRIVAAGGAGDAVLVGLGANGQVDPGFGEGGQVVQRASLPSWTKQRAIAAEPDGGLVVTGVTDSGAVEEHPFWMRFTADGKPIPTSSGAPFASPPVVAEHLVAAGPRYLYALVDKEKRGTFVAKFEQDGTLVRSFGGQGFAPLPRGLESTSLVVDPAGGVTAVGHQGTARMGAYRLTAAGRPARGFGHRGLATVRFRGASETEADTGAMLPGGGLVLGGLADEHLAVAELGPDGRLDHGFSRDGFFTCGCGGTRPSGVDVVTRRGQVYLLDHWRGARAKSTSLVKLSGAGRLDRTFAGRGYRMVRIGSPVGLFVLGSRLVATGQKSSTAGPARVREFRLDGSAAGSFSGGSQAFVAGGHSFRGRLSAALQPNGRVVFAGEPRAKREFDGAPLELLGLR
jgi:uncharacterized delta-60 repeat protein